MESEILKYVVQGGVGVVVAVVVLLFYRADGLKRDKAWEEHCKGTQEMWKQVMEDKRGLIVADQETREAHIKALNELTLYLKTMNGKLTDIAVWEGVKYTARPHGSSGSLGSPRSSGSSERRD